MFLRKLTGISIILALLIAGIWTVFRPVELPPESVTRQRALRQALAPAGFDSVGTAVEINNATLIVHKPVETIPVRLADVPAGVYDPSNQYDRWLRGEIDIDEREGVVSAAEMMAMQEASLALPPGRHIQTAHSDPGAANILVPDVSFDSIDFTQCCGGGGGTVPPDPELAVGPNHIIAVVNIAFEIYDKQGNSVKAPTTFSSFFSAGSLTGCTTKLFDPNVLYDESADRFFLAIDGDGDYYCAAVSASSDPLGTWHLYRFTANSSGYFFDYPHVGIGRDAIYMGGNMFNGNIFADSRIWAFDKVAMYAGLPANSVERTLGSSQDTPQPLKLHGYNQGAWPASGPHYFLTSTNFNGRTYTLFSWSSPFGANVLNAVGTVNLETATGVTAGMPINVTQSGGGTIQANDHRPLDFEYRNGHGWTTMTIGCNPGSGTVNCVRWAQIELATATVVKAGVVASNGNHRFFPDLAVNHNNDMLIGYTRSSSSMFPSIWYVNQYGFEGQLKAGEITYTAFDEAPHRWGDYTGMTIDPDGQTFWYLGQYSKNTGNSQGRWGTYISSFVYSDFHSTIYLPIITASEPSPPPPPPPPPTTIVNGDFESGPVGWTEFSTHGWPIIVSASGLPTGLPPRSGNWAAWLGGEYDDISYIEQQVTVFAGTPYLAYWHWIGSQDDCGYDFARVMVNGAAILTYDLCYSQNTGGWQKQVVNLSAYNGQTVMLRIQVNTDDFLNSNLFIDDVSFQAGATSPENEEPSIAMDASDAAVSKSEMMLRPGSRE